MVAGAGGAGEKGEGGEGEGAVVRGLKAEFDALKDYVLAHGGHGKHGLV